ncbi:MAG: hypothetical protein AABY22_03160 [Nanoarchaeota archaeon]
MKIDTSDESNAKLEDEIRQRSQSKKVKYHGFSIIIRKIRKSGEVKCF